jgi:peptidoglycan/xylan/chitin deacetylase (PgdA/CDA1 family)
MTAFSQTFGNGLGTQGALLNLCTEYKTLLAAMPVTPSYLDKRNQDRFFKDLQAYGIFNKIKLGWNFSAHEDESSRLNIMNPAKYKAVKVGTPVYEQYGGFTGNRAVAAYLRPGFNPSVNFEGMSQNDCGFMVFFGSDTNDGYYDFGANGTGHFRMSARNNANKAYANCNEATGAYFDDINNAANILGISRGTSGIETTFANYLFKDFSIASTGLSGEICLCGINGSSGFQGSNRNIRGILITTHLTKIEMAYAATAFNDYLTNYNTNVIEGIRPSITFTFDDGSADHYNKVFPLFVNKGISGTFWKIGNQGFTFSQALEMYNSGMDIQDHSYNHIDLTSLSEADLRSQFVAQNNAFIAAGLPAPKYIAYPFGARNALVDSITLEYRLSGRTVGIQPSRQGIKQANIFKDTTKTNVPSIDLAALTTSNIATYTAEMDILKATKTAFVYMSHGITDDYRDALGLLIDHAKSINLDIINYDQLYQKLI